MTRARIVYPHQLFTEQLDVCEGTLVVLVEPDLFFRQYRFHTHKLVLHRASLRHFEQRMARRGLRTVRVESRARTGTHDALVATLREHDVDAVSCFDVVDVWLERDLRRATREAGVELEVEETPGFLTSDADVRAQLGGRRPRMQHFYEWQRRRLGVLVDGPDGDRPVGGRWSFDDENRQPWPTQGLDVPRVTWPRRDDVVTEAIAWVAEEFADNPGDPETFRWPVRHDQAQRWLRQFLEHRFATFGPYEDAMAAEHDILFHSVLTPALNVGLLDPRDVLDQVLAHAEEHDVELASVEGFVRQLIGWREYMRGCYVVHGAAMRTRNVLGLTRELDDAWWDGTTGLDPVDRVVERVLGNGYAHHIERLMVLGNAALLLRVDPDEVYEWFMAMFVDAYDWVMVPNVYGMSQFAAGELMTTKPYVSGSHYLTKMGDWGPGAWREVWDGLYWQFVDDHRDGFAANPRSSMMVRQLDRMKTERRDRLREVARAWLP